MNNFQALEVVDRGSETQSQVVENLNNFFQQVRVNIMLHSASNGENIMIFTHEMGENYLDLFNFKPNICKIVDV